MAIKYSEANLGQIEAAINKLGGMDGLRRFLAGELVVSGKKVSVSKSALLAFIDSIELPAVECFVASKKFVTNSTPDGVRLYFVSDNIKTNFLAKVEKDVAAAALYSHRLTKDSLDKSILDELGDRATTTLAHLWELLKKQPKGEKGVLLTNGYANIFYVEDVNGNRWAVYAYWSAGSGWCVGALSVSDPDGWDAGRVVFSR